MNFVRIMVSVDVPVNHCSYQNICNILRGLLLSVGFEPEIAWPWAMSEVTISPCHWQPMFFRLLIKSVCVCLLSLVADDCFPWWYCEYSICKSPLISFPLFFRHSVTPENQLQWSSIDKNWNCPLFHYWSNYPRANVNRWGILWARASKGETTRDSRMRLRLRKTAIRCFFVFVLPLL